jgi:four helix bundle protein
MYQFEKLEIWKLSIVVIKDAYKLTKEFPKEEQYSLSNQIQRAAVSISLNIAEGRGSNSQKEFANFLYTSIKSLYEVVAGFKIAIALGYFREDDLDYVKLSEDLDHLCASLHSLVKRVNSGEKANG